MVLNDHTGRSRQRDGRDRTDTGCTHTRDCPLFPFLNASLRSWRDYYCDSRDGWRDCARYKLAARGEPIPISLLPNGKTAGHLGDRDENSRPPVSERPRRSTQAPFSQQNRETPQSWWFVPTEPLEPVYPTPNLQPPGKPAPAGTRGAPRVPGRRRGWWTRLTDWMKAPA